MRKGEEGRRKGGWEGGEKHISLLSAMYVPSAPPPPQVADYHFLPITAQSAERVRSCLVESEEVREWDSSSPPHHTPTPSHGHPPPLPLLCQVPRDFSALVDHSLFRLDTSVLPDTIQ